jgi:hypothetical protein
VPVRSDRLSGPTIKSSAVSPPLFTVPAGETWLVKRVVAENTSALATQWTWDVTVGGVTGALYVAQLAPGDVSDHETWWALDPGAIFGGRTPSIFSVIVSVFGAKLLGFA